MTAAPSPRSVEAHEIRGDPHARRATMVDRDDNRTSLAQPLWPLMLAAFVSTLPITASRLLVASIAADLQTTPAVVGGLFGLVGAAALLVGFAAAPLIDRAPRA